jgi:S1-C subfamily serine protease
MRFSSAAFVLLLGSLFSLIAHAPLEAQTSPGGILEVWLKARESADAPNSEKVSLYLKSKALVIGNDGYDGRSWPALSNGIRDAEEVAKGLAAQGFEVTLKKNLPSSELDRALKTFFIFEGADVNTRLLVWFAGHGSTIDGEGYIVPVDAPSQKTDAEFRDKAISLRRFGEYMREAKARHVLAIFDSCFSGSVFNVARAAPPPAITLATTQPVREFISSGDAEQQVSDDGTFRKLFLDVLAGKETQADANGDGYVTGTELGLFLQQKVTNLTNNRQTPLYGKLNVLGYDRGDFVFQVGTLQAPTAPPPINTTLPTSEAAQAWAATLGTTSIAVLEEFIRQFADTPYGPMARARLEELKKSQTATIPPTTTPSPKVPSEPQPASPGWLGVRIQQVTDDIAETLNIKPARGALVAGVDDKGPAKPAGVEPGDVIVRFDGKDIKEMRDLPRIVADTPVGKGVEVTILRKGREENKTVTLGRQASLTTSSSTSPAALEKPGRRQFLGMELANASADIRQEYKLPPSANGIVVTAVAASSSAASKKIVTGDRIVRATGETVSSIDDLETRIDAIKRAGSKAALLLVAGADGAQRFVALPLDEAQSVARLECERLTSLDDEQLGPSARKAIAACRQALDALPDNAELMFRLGRAHRLDGNYAEAKRLFLQASNLGNSNGFIGLGVMYRNGSGVTQDFREAAGFFRKAADLGNRIAMNYLGMMYANGRGVPRDLGEAEKLWRRAAELGDEGAKNNLASTSARRRDR